MCCLYYSNIYELIIKLALYRIINFFTITCIHTISFSEVISFSFKAIDEQSIIDFCKKNKIKFTNVYNELEYYIIGLSTIKKKTRTSRYMREFANAMIFFIFV